LFSGNLIMPTTLVYDFQKFRDVRFHEEFRHWGEEILFFAGLAARKAKFGFSTLPGARRGHGINVYDKSGWGTPGFLARLRDELRIYRYATREWDLTDRQRAASQEKFWRIRRDFAATFVARIARLEFSQLHQFARFSREDPIFPMLFPFLLLQVAWKKLAD